MHQKTSTKDSYKTQDANCNASRLSRLSRLARRSVMHLALPNSFALWMMCLGCFGSQWRCGEKKRAFAEVAAFAAFGMWAERFWQFGVWAALHLAASIHVSNVSIREDITLMPMSRNVLCKVARSRKRLNANRWRNWEELLELSKLD